MKTRSLLRLISFIILILSSQEETAFSIDNVLQKNAKLKCILHFATINSEAPIRIAGEYVYNEDNRISKVSSPLYQNGKIVGTMHYDLYEYNSIGQLMEITRYNANRNSPTGFINLSNYSYTYSNDGKKEKEYIEYPQIHSFEYSLYRYNSDDLLIRIEKYGNTDKLERFVVNEYNDSGKLAKEIFYRNDDQPYSYIQHFYSKGLNIKSDVYRGRGSDMEHIREILKKYDENNNLIVIESKELSLWSSTMSYVWKYEYYEK